MKQPTIWRSILVRFLLVALGASMVGWSLNHGLSRVAGMPGFGLYRLLEGAALFVGMGLLWSAVLRPSELRKSAPRWKRVLAEDTPLVLALAVFGTIMAPMLR